MDTRPWRTGDFVCAAAAAIGALPRPASLEKVPLAIPFCMATIMVCLVFFAFTTILGWNYYGERCIEYLFNRNRKVVRGYRWLYILAIFIGPYMTVQAVWNIADIFNALMAFPNLIALAALSRVVFAETKAYFGNADDVKEDLTPEVPAES